MPITKITGIVLAGGQGKRLGGVDKGLQLLRGRPMIAWVLERFHSQVTELFISANQNRDKYATFGYPVLADEIDGFAGPLAGIQSALRHASNSLVATVPCDSPFLPADLVARLHVVMQRQEADVAVARTGSQPHPVFNVMRRGVGPHLDNYLASGGRKVDEWYSTLKVVEVPFDDEPALFSNINTPEDVATYANRAAP